MEFENTIYLWQFWGGELLHVHVNGSFMIITSYESAANMFQVN